MFSFHQRQTKNDKKNPMQLLQTANYRINRANVPVGRFILICLMILTVSVFLYIPDVAGQENRNEKSVTLKWLGIQSVRISEEESAGQLSFEGAAYPGDYRVPYWHHNFMAKGAGKLTEVILTDVTTVPLTSEEAALIASVEDIRSDFSIRIEEVGVRKEISYQVFILPVRRSATGGYEKLSGFTPVYKESPRILSPTVKSLRKGNPVLASGTWYKLKVDRTGMYRLDYQALVSLGFSGSGAGQLKVYGMGGAMLPEHAGAHRPDGLTEIAIMVSDGGDGSIDQGDYLLFYGEGAGQWIYDSGQGRFVFQRHQYAENNYYYITRSNSPGLRVTTQPPPSGTPTHQVTTYHDFYQYEKDSINLIKSGKLWLGEVFNLKTSYAFSFSFSNADVSAPAEIFTSVAARSLTSSSFTVTSGSQSVSIPVTPVYTAYNSQYAFPASRTMQVTFSGNQIPVQITYNKPMSSSEGWLDFILINLRRHLRYNGTQMRFRDPLVTGAGNIAKYTLDQAAQGVQVWDITDPFNPENVQATLSSGSLIFKSDASGLREFVTFNPTGCYTPEVSGKLVNQNLTGTAPADMFIVTHPLFLSAANRLAGLHAQNSGLKVTVFTTSEVYNEFSSGKQDPGAIRDFMKLLYDRAQTPQELPRYLLLIGDGSYDNLNRLPGNTCFVPTFQSEESLHPAYSFVTDDFFGMLDDSEGINGSGHLDLGVGRIPVATAAEATQMVDKIERYMSNNTLVGDITVCASGSSTRPMGDWRNHICIVADDEDGNLHVDQAEMLAGYLEQNHPVWNLNKIYLDAYPQVSISGGHRYPDVNEAINRQMARGSLVLNYIGHGGELGWGHERILRIDDINSWDNYWQMPLFLTSTCEFSRFDDPGRRSAGELVYLNAGSGGIAMFTTTRLAFASSNYAFNNAFYQNLFRKEQGEHLRLGDIFRQSKIDAGSVSSNRNMVILGDPALMLAYPEHRVIATHINDAPVSGSVDTLKALSKITIKGMVTDQDGLLMPNFNGTLYPAVYDKKTMYSTLANDDGSYKKNFGIQKNILYKGKVSIKDGLFSFTFIVPKDIQYAFGNGKISFYAENGTEDAHGYYNQVVVGGNASGSITDQSGPILRLFMNDSSFVSGGTTDPDPALYALLWDENGINTTGGSIGHDIVAVLDENTQHSIILNDYYEADLDSYQSGSILYQLSKLSEGPHRISLKAWDILNNSSEVSLDFLVVSSEKPILTHVLNYPNPFTTRTEFWFEHNQPCCDLQVMIEVYSISGKLVKTLRETVPTTGYRAAPVAWDGLDDYGERLARGVYVYRVSIRNQQGQEAEKFEKLVILK